VQRWQQLGWTQLRVAGAINRQSSSNLASNLASNLVILDHPFLRSNVLAVLPHGTITPWLAIQLQFAELKEWKWHGIKMIKQLHQLQTLLMDLLKDHRLSMESGNYPA